MNHIATASLMLYLGVASAYAQPYVTLRFSGNGAGASPINLLVPGTTTIEENVAGNGALGQFTYRQITADANVPSSTPPSTCSGPTHLYLPRLAGGGILRFDDGSLLNVTLLQGADCIDLVANKGHCTLTLKVTGGTGRFKNAFGVLTYTETALTVLTDSSGNPVFFDETGEITGTISGISGGGQNGQ